MLNITVEFFRSIFDVNFFTALVVVGLGGVGYCLVRFMTESLLLACLYTPFMMLGGLVSNYLKSKYFATPLTDKDSDTVLGVAVGVLAMMMVLILVTRGINAFAEYRMRHSRAGTNSLLSSAPR